MLLCLLCTLYIEGQDLNKSGDVTKKVAASEKYDYYLYEGISKKKLGHNSEAFALFSYCLTLDEERGEALFQLGGLSIYLKEYEKAIKYYTGAVESDPQNYWYNEALFFALYSIPERDEEAISQLEEMVKLFPNKGVLQMQLIDLYTQSNQYDKLIDLLDAIEKKLGKSEQLSMQKFSAYSELGEDKKAFKEIEMLIEAYPNDLRYTVILANLYINKGRYKKGLNLLEKVLDVEPNNSIALYALVDYYDKVGDEERAMEQMRLVMLDKDQDSEVRLNLMRQFIMKTNSDPLQVEPLFKEVIAAMPDDDQMPMLYAQYLISINKQDETEPVLKHILTIDPTNSASRLMLLGVAIRRNDYKAVIDICEEGILYAPETIEFYYYLSIAYSQAKMSDKALETVDLALDVMDDSTPKQVVSDFYAIKGDLYHEQGDMDSLYAAYDKALELYADNYGVLNNYAYYLSVEKRDLDRAEAMSKKTIEKEPTNSTFLDTYAWILFEQKKYTEAKIYIQQALDNDKEAGSVLFDHAGDIYYMAGEKEKAVQLWKKALGMDPENETLKLKLKKGKIIF